MNNFDIDMYWGIYYEVALHDYTQDPGCPASLDLSCMTSNKTFNNTAQTPYIHDDFDMHCDGQNYGNITYHYNLTNISGYFYGDVESTHALNGHAFGDTVVATGDMNMNKLLNKKQYEWIIEFQCKTQTVDNEEFVKFIGIQFYSMYNHPSQSMMNDMIDTAYKQGLGVYLNRSFHIADQDNCTYPWNTTFTAIQ